MGAKPMAVTNLIVTLPLNTIVLEIMKFYFVIKTHTNSVPFYCYLKKCSFACSETFLKFIILHKWYKFRVSIKDSQKLCL